MSKPSENLSCLKNTVDEDLDRIHLLSLEEVTVSGGAAAAAAEKAEKAGKGSKKEKKDSDTKVKFASSDLLGLCI